MPDEKRLLPLSGISSVPWLWLGTWSMGGEGFGPHDLRDSLRVLQRAISSGITHFDTSGFYAHGRSEELLSKIIKKARTSLFISTKGGLHWCGRRVVHDASPEALRSQLTESLKRLGTDYIDLYQLHWPDPKVPLQESLDALKDLVKEGLVRYWGAGNLSPEEIERFLSGQRNIPLQIHFNPIHRDYRTLKAAAPYCINCIVSALEQGLLSRRIAGRGIDALTKKDFRRRNPYFKNPAVLRWTETLKVLCERYGVSMSHAVFSWIGATEGVHVLVAGPRRPEQFDDIMDFVESVQKKALLVESLKDRIIDPARLALIVPEPVLRHLNTPVEGITF